MNREMEFRAWEHDRKKMCYGYQYNIGDAEQNKYPLMQFTGLKDKNGKEIYEGDIVKYDGELTTVIFCYGSFFLEKFNFRSSDWVNADYMIVKGNIYENPELIGDKND